ncbi:MAG: DoxX family protein [Gemmatimonadales bacterium]
MPEQLYPWMHLMGRILFSMVFIGSGMSHFMNMGGMTEYARAKGVPAAKLAVAVTGLMALAGGITVLLGWHRFIGAGLLVIFLVPTAFLMHPFWKETDAQAKQNEMAHFMKTLALAGAALFVAYHAGFYWPMSLGQ